MFTKSLITAGLLGLAIFAQPALAQPALAQPDAVQSDASQAAQQLVHFADLDLTSPAGQAKLDARLRRAAAAVCEAGAGPRPLNEVLEARRCYRTALQSAQRAMASAASPKMVSR
jgi:UrcA family protein